MATDEATFRINIDGNASTVSKDISSSARQAALAIDKFESEAKALGGELRRLKGNSDEIKATKAALKKRIDEAKTSVSTLTAELLKQGTSYAAASAAAKKYGDGVGRLSKLKGGAGKLLGGASNALAPVGKKLGAAFAPLTKRLGVLLAPVGKKVGTALAPAGRALAKFGGSAKKVFAGVGKAAKPAAEGLGSVAKSIGPLLAEGAAIGSVAIAAVAAAAVAGAAAVVAFGLASSDAAARMQRQREALLGNAKDAKVLGDQIAALAGKVPQGVEELNGLAVSLSKTRLTGKAMVDTMNAVAQASGAVDGAAGAKLQEIITRGQNAGRFSLQRLELQGTGIDFDDVAKEYAAGTKKSLEAARREIMTGGATLEAGAAAVAKATEKKFGGMNLKNAFSLANAPKKFLDQFRLLSSGINLEPLGQMFQKVFGQLSPDAPLGGAVKKLMETVGSGFVDIAAKSIPVLLEGFKWLIVGALKVATYFYEMKKKVADAFAADGWIGAGKAIVDGIVKGIIGRNEFLVTAIKNMAKTVKDAFTGKLEIHSPSRVFMDYGQNTVEGYAQGVDRGSRRASEAVEGMVSMPKQSGGAGGGAEPQIVVNIHGAPSGGMQGAPSPAFLAELSRALRSARTARGLAAA